MEAFKVISKGMFTTIQDLGRYGYRNYGVPISGAIDRDALIDANTILGNDKEQPCLEILASGLILQALNDFHISLTGANANIYIDEKSINQYERILIKKNQILSIKSLNDELRIYLAIEGGIKKEKLLGSYSVNEAIKFGKRLNINEYIYRNNVINKKFLKVKKRKKINNIFKVYLGPDLDKFTKKGINTFLNTQYVVSSQIDRMGIRLNGPPIEHIDKADVISHAVVFGSIQVPNDGNPIILMADCQTTGGYAVIATIVLKDISKLGQLKPGDKIVFKK